MRTLTTVLLAAACAPLAHAAVPVDQLGRSAIWQLPAQKNKQVWAVIHPKPEDPALLHLEVLARKRGAPAWSVEHLCNHLALAPELLAANVVKPLKHGAVYPESFDTAYARWQKGPEHPACSGDFAACLKSCAALEHEGH